MMWGHLLKILHSYDGRFGKSDLYKNLIEVTFMQLKITDSLHDYLHNPSVATAVDSLLSQKSDEMRLYVEWEEITDYHNALLMAYKVRHDYVIFLKQAWDKVWDIGSLKDRGWNEISFKEIRKEELPTPEVVWGDSLYRIYKNRDNSDLRLSTALELSPEDGVIAYFSCKSRSREIGENLELSDRWSTGLDKDGFRHTCEKLAVPDDIRGVDLQSLANAAKEVIESLSSENHNIS